MEDEDFILIITFTIIVIINIIVFDIFRLKKKEIKETVHEKRPSSDDKGAMTSTDGSGVPSERCRVYQEKPLRETERLGKKAMRAEEFEELHAAVAEGDLETVRGIVDSHGQEQHFSHDHTSALYKAFECKKYDVISFLIHKGAKIHESEVYDLYRLDVDLLWLNYLLLHYNKKSERSCVYRLMSLSQSPQVLDGERLNAVVSMYECFFRSDIIRLLMCVLEGEAFDIVYDFESDKVNRIHRYCAVECEIFGLTLPNSKEIFIGAKHLLSYNPHKRQKVYGVVAEELCHLALTTVFENNAKPYKHEDSRLAREFRQIVLAVKSLIDSSSSIESVIQDVFKNYQRDSWECELIARVPHVVGIYGEEFGRRIFRERSELSSLLSFYEKNVQEKCKLYTDPSVNTKSHREMERLTKKIDFISFKERKTRPLKQEFESFRDYLVVMEGISVIATNCAKLCTLHIYHELKKEYDQLVEKKCLFFSRKCFERNVYKIRDAMKGYFWEYLILVMDKRELNLSRFQEDYLEDLEEFIKKGMRLIMISSSQSADKKFDFQNAVNYRWSDLSEEFKAIQECIKYVFKGEEEVTYVRKEYFPKVFSDEDICMILSGEVIEVDDGNELFSQGYVPETYIKREFNSTVVDEKVFTNLPPHTNIILSGLKKGELKEFPFDKELVQWIEGPDDEIKSEKSVFVIDKATPMSFEDFTKKTHNKNNICLHYYEKEFYPVDASSSGDVLSGHMKQKTFTEGEILNILKRKGIVLISDNAGYGKSTVISSLIDNVKRSHFRSWNWRINFNKFSVSKSNPLSLANVHDKRSDEEVLNQLFLMLGLKNGLERHLFRTFSKEGYCFVFFDGFDEIPSGYKNSALKLLSTVRKQTAVNMIISTRKHHQEELENLLNTYSHQLVPLSKKDQVRYLDKLWKNKLKYPNGRGTIASQNDRKKVPGKIRNILRQSEEGRTNLDKELHDLIIALKEIDLRDGLDCIRSKVDDLKLGKLAENVIDETLLDKEILQFMGIPLHLFMAGIIYYDSNFSVKIQNNVYGIYSDFIERKVMIFVEEKQGILRDGREKEEILKKRREDAYRIHIRLANQLMDTGKLDIDMSKEDFELCTALGIVFLSCGKIDFLHFTFAEFFKAESLRLNFSKDVAFEILFEEKYNVVRRFISSSLEKKGFENLATEFFLDLDFLVEILVQFVRKCLTCYSSFYDYLSNLYASSVVQIVKYLMETFEETADGDLVYEFVERLESWSQDWCCIGGCLSVKMLKTLLGRGVDSKMILGVVRYCSNPEEVIDVVSECISLETGVKTDRRNGWKVKILSRLLQIKDSNGVSLFQWTICNVRLEIFANLLKFFRDVLGKEGFVNGVIRSKEYRIAMDGFIRNVGHTRISGLLKEFHVVFGDDIEILFGINLKFRVLQRTLHVIDVSSNAFEEAIHLFKDCFGFEKLKEVLLIRGSDGNCLLSRLVFQNRNVIKHLSIIKNILDDKIRMRQILKSKDLMLRNVFQLAAENKSMFFGVFLRFCNENLEKKDVKEMLVCADKNGVNLVHLLFKINPSERLVQQLNVIKSTLVDEELFKQFLKKRDKEMSNVLHFAGLNRNEIEVSFLESHLSESEIEKLLVERNVKGMTCLHSGASCDAANLPVFLDYSYEMLKCYGSRFQELVLAKDEDGNTFLHVFVEKYYVYGKEEVKFVNVLVRSLKEKVTGDVFRKLLIMRNKRGDTFLQIESKEQTVECFKGILEKSLCEELLE